MGIDKMPITRVQNIHFRQSKHKYKIKNDLIDYLAKSCE